MKTVITILFLLLSHTFLCSQNLCGYWIGYGYQCLRFNPDKGYQEIYNVPYELFQSNDSMRTIKIIGDNCVTSGSMSWDGILVPSEKRIKNVRILLGNLERPNSVFSSYPDFFLLQDSIYSKVSLLKFKRLTCEQAQKLGANLLDQRYICDCAETEVCTIDLPNAFTPNNDGLNDTFFPITACQLKAYDLKIYNRWGNLVFETQEMPIVWDGTHRGRALASDLYVWVINATMLNGKVLKQSGEVTLLR